MAKVETLVDNFASQQPWWQVFDPGNVAWIDGRLRIDSVSAYPWVATLPVAGGFDLTDSAVFVEVEPNPPAYMRQIFFRVGPNPTVDDLAITVRDDPWDLQCRVTAGGAQDNTIQRYDPVAMRYLRIRHAGSTVFWETAPEAAGPWTIRRQAPQPPWPLTAVHVRLEAGNWGGLGGGSFAWFDNLNYVEAPTPPAGIETFTAGKKWVSAYAQHHSIQSLWKGGIEVFRHSVVIPPLANLLSNGSFEADTAGWTGSLTLSRQALSPAHGEFGAWYGRNTGTVNGAHWLQRSAALPVVNGRSYYLRALAATATATMGNVVQLQNSTTALAGVPATSLTPANTWQLTDGIWQANTSSLTLRANYTGGSGNQTRTGWLDNVMVLDLTDAFGAGNEPDIDTIREIVADGGGYWDGTWTP